MSSASGNIRQLNGHIIDETNEQLETYTRNSRKLFVESPSFKQCETKLDENGYVVISGSPGDGKTTMGLEVLCRVRNKGRRKAVIICHGKDWEKLQLFSNTDQQLVILFDDMLGKFDLNESLKNYWVSQFPKMLPFVQNGKIQVIVTCRESIFRSAKNEIESCQIFDTESRIHLSGPQCEYPLDAETKFNIIKKRVEFGENIEICGNESDQVLSPPFGQKCRISMKTLKKISKKSCVGFVQTCEVFVSAPEYLSQGVTFFNHAAEFLVREIERLRSSRNNKYDYCALACVLVKQGLSVGQIDGDEIVREIAESCGINLTKTKNILKSEINLAVDRLTSTYVIKNNDKYQFQHNSWAESVFKSFFSSNPSLLFKYCDFKLIHDLITTKGAREKSAVFYEISNSHNLSFFERLVSEMAAGNVHVLCHRCFTDAPFAEEFCRWMDSDRKRKQTVLLSVEPEGDLGLKRGCDRSALWWSAHKADVSLVVWVVEGVSKLKSESDMKFEMSEALVSACNGGNLAVVTWLLSQTGIEARMECIIVAADRGDVGVIGQLLKHTKFTSSVLSWAGMLACQNHHSEVIDLLLTQPGIDRGENWGECLSVVARWGYVDLVAKLIRYGGFTSSELSWAVIWACQNHHNEVLDLLLALPGIDRCEEWGECLSAAARCGFVDVVTKLIKYGGFTSHALSWAVMGACDEHHTEVIDLLLAQAGVDGGEHWGQFLREAAMCEHRGDPYFANLLRSKGFHLPDNIEITDDDDDY